MKVVALGDPVMDVLVHVAPHFLADAGVQPGGCLPVQEEEMVHLLGKAALHAETLRRPGGSAANVAKAVANLAAGHWDVSMMGMLGVDDTGREYRAGLAAQHVRAALVDADSGAASATCLCLITPDGQRTMRTLLGAAAKLTHADALPPGWAGGAALLHCEGYCLWRPALARSAMAAARQAGAQVSLDLASFELVAACAPALRALLAGRLVDLVFCNQEEALALAQVAGVGQNGSDEAGLIQAAQTWLLQWCQVSVVSLGAAGCVARTCTGECARSPAEACAVTDTIGAGDCFTGGFLWAYLQGALLQVCTQTACAAGAAAVQTVGADLPAERWRALRAHLGPLLQPAQGRPDSSLPADLQTPECCSLTS